MIEFPTAIREYAEEMGVTIFIRDDGRLIINAANEGGFNCTQVDLQDVIDWVSENKPEMLEPLIGD